MIAGTWSAVLLVTLNALNVSEKVDSDTEAEKVVMIKSGEGWRFIRKSENSTTADVYIVGASLCAVRRSDDTLLDAHYRRGSRGQNAKARDSNLKSSLFGHTKPLKAPGRGASSMQISELLAAKTQESSTKIIPVSSGNWKNIRITRIFLSA
jgi:hypothetical protein